MRILVLHSRYRSGSASGENRVVDDEVRLLMESGHEVILRSPSVNGEGPARLGASAVWARRAVHEVARLIDEERPDIVHCHNLFPMLSPAALRAAGEATPVLLTLHNFRLMCLPATFLRDGKPCEDCLGHVPWRGVLHRCYRDSVLASGALASSLVLHRAIRTFDGVRLFVAVSDFVRKKHVQAGLRASRIRLKPNFAWPGRRREGPGEYFLYLGRLSSEKGLSSLVRSWQPGLGQLAVVGDGPELPALRSMQVKGVEFRGAVRAEEVPEIMARARALVVPSISYEGAPRAILEAYAAGVPVVASNIGGLPEVVLEGESGLLVAPGDSPAWAGAIERLTDDRESERLGEGAYRLWEERFSPERGLEGLEAAYKAVLQ